MKIKELRLKNFGKFTNKEIHFLDGMNVIYGENESGKSTLYTFIRAMLFGLERGRGRAAAQDAFSRYEPWENPNYYCGEMKFESGDKEFLLSRNFDRYGKNETLVCLEDAEELSVKDGDLQMLMGDLSPQIYDDTMAMAQMRVKPGMTLSEELKNYASNYYATGDGELDLAAAIDYLKEQKKESLHEMQKQMEKRQDKREHISQEMSYVWRDIHKLEEEQAHLEEEIEFRKVRERESRLLLKQDEEEPKHMIDEIRPSKWRVHPLEILAAVLAVVLCVWLLKRPWNYLVAIILVLLSSIYVWNRMKISKKVEKTEPEKILEEITPQEEKIPTDRLKWELERNALELGDKRVRYSNLKEDLEELDGISDEERILNAQAEARQLAIDKIQELSGEMQKKLRGKLNDRVSEIMEFITEGKYTRLNVEEGLNISLLSEGRKVDIARVSQGTAEQVYFALRMATSEVLLEEELPVILDDTFVSYDEERLESVLEWLAKSGKQVLLFTCQKREMKILSEMGVKNCNYIKLQ